MKLLNSILLFALFALVCNESLAQVPERPANASPVVDLAGIINNDSLVNAMNAELDSLSKKTQNQIVVVTVNDMGDADPKTFATELGKKWGVGGKKLNNGFVMVIKPKNDNGDGLIGFATGYGLEGALPDVFCKRLQDDYMVPHLKEGDYAGGIKAAIDEIVPVVLTEYNQSQALASNTGKKNGSGKGWLIIAVILGVIALISLLRRRRKADQAATQPQSSQLANKDKGENQEVKETEKTEEAEKKTEKTEETEKEKPEKKATKPQDAPKPYKYEYGGGEFGGGGASTKF